MMRIDDERADLVRVAEFVHAARQQRANAAVAQADFDAGLAIEPRIPRPRHQLESVGDALRRHDVDVLRLGQLPLERVFERAIETGVARPVVHGADQDPVAGPKGGGRRGATGCHHRDGADYYGYRSRSCKRASTSWERRGSRRFELRATSCEPLAEL